MGTVDQRIEQRGLWWAFHKHLIIDIFEWLRDQLGGAYLVDLESEILLIPHSDGPTRSVSPDVDVTVLSPPVGEVGSPGLTPSPALLELDEPVAEYEQYAIQIRRRDLPDPVDPFGLRVVSVIELLSPSNKGLTGSFDQRKFLAKRRDYLSSPVSYIEIDLLQEGERALPNAVEQLNHYPYMAWASQVQIQSRHHWGWGWGTADPLPSLTLPLDYPHAHVLDLAGCYARAYDRNRWPARLAME